MRNTHICLVLLTTSALAGVPHKMVAGQPARADSVNANFEYLSAKIDSILLVKIDSIKLSTMLAAKADTGSALRMKAQGYLDLYKLDSSTSFYVGGNNPFSLGTRQTVSWGTSYSAFLSAEWARESSSWNRIRMFSPTIELLGSLSVSDTLICNKDLIVQGQIHASTNTIAVPDYVFDPDYKLMPFPEVDAYIKVNRHLPEVPNASEIQANGLDLVHHNLLLLKKIEELTLYTIQLHIQVNEQAQLIRDLQSP